MAPGKGCTTRSASTCALACASLGRTPQPSAAIVVDSQSAKTSGVGGEARGYERAKQVRGRKRHILVDTEGFVLKVSRSTAPTSQTRTASGCC